MQRVCLSGVWIFFLLLVAHGCHRHKGVAGNSAAPPKKDAQSRTPVSVGDAAPQFNCQTIDGEPFSLAGMRGKIVLIYLFSTHCGPCNRMAPYLQSEILDVIKDKGFRMIAVGTENSTVELIQYREKRALRLPIVADPGRRIYGLFDEAGGIPHIFVVGRDGNIILECFTLTKTQIRQLAARIQQELQEKKA
jgi:peroxiredoxin